MISTRQNFENWQEAGSLDTARRANTLWKRLLAEYQRPAMDRAVEDELIDYVARRKLEIQRAA
jgi:trimethylamine--corrinoid protein Co-methyltransferase